MNEGLSRALRKTMVKTGFTFMTQYFPCRACKTKLQVSYTFEISVTKDLSKERIVSGPHLWSLSWGKVQYTGIPIKNKDEKKKKIDQWWSQFIEIGATCLYDMIVTLFQAILPTSHLCEIGLVCSNFGSNWSRRITKFVDKANDSSCGLKQMPLMLRWVFWSKSIRGLIKRKIIGSTCIQLIFFLFLLTNS